MRVTISYLHCMELVSENYKTFCSMIINACDSGSILCACIVFYYYDNDVAWLLRIVWYIAMVASVLYMILIPESPRWQFMQDCNSKEGIKNMNYIAWFNGSKFRVPEDATMD